MDDADLLRTFADTGSETAFAEFVRRCAPLVYGAAVRRLAGNRHLAEDVAQTVFTAVARDAGRLAQHPDLQGWLFLTTRHVAANLMRGERRRQAREQAFASDPAAETAATATDLTRIRPVLDDVLMELRELDRQVLLLRFYRGCRLADIAAQLNSSENAMQKRIERALERVRSLLSRRGISSTTLALAFALEQQAAVALPPGLVTTATAAGIAGGTGATGGTAASALGPLGKLPLTAAAALTLAGTAALLWWTFERGRSHATLPNVPATTLEAPPAAPPMPAPTAPRIQQMATAAPAAPPASPRIDPTPVRNALPTPVVPSPVVAPSPRGSEPLVPLEVSYPPPLFAGLPRLPGFPHLEPPGTLRERVRVPASNRLLSRGQPVTSSDPLPVIGEWSLVTDGDNSSREGTYVELGPGRQWIQIDLGGSAAIHAVALWHYHAQARVYHDVVVQVSDDPAFTGGVTTLFNNDHDNSSGLGAGRDHAYIETNRGLVVNGGATRGRYVRFYSNGNSADELNHYCEVEVHGTPATGSSAD